LKSSPPAHVSSEEFFSENSPSVKFLAVARQL
jgi:hypothetical protein